MAVERRKMARKTKRPMSSVEFLETLVCAPGPSTFEGPASAVWRDYLLQAGIPSETDIHGNSTAIVNPSGSPSIMLAAHIDTIGFMVRHIDDDDPALDPLFCVSQIGGIDTAIALGQEVIVLAEGQPVPGVIGMRPTHLEDDDDEEDPFRLYVDVGASDRDALERMAPIGTPIIFKPRFGRLLGNRIFGTGLDNRLGAWCVAEAMCRLATSPDCSARVCAVATVQEETGLAGARMACERLRPDLAVVVDVTFGIDTPNLSRRQHGNVRIGKGPVIAVGGAAHPLASRIMCDLAYEGKIPVQREAMAGAEGGTETDEIFKTGGGVLSGLVMVPTRYMHTPVELAQLDDAEKTTDLLVSYCERAPGLLATWKRP